MNRCRSSRKVEANKLKSFPTHASAVAETKFRFLFAEEATGAGDLPSKGWSEGGILEKGKRWATSFSFSFFFEERGRESLRERESEEEKMKKCRLRN